MVAASKNSRDKMLIGNAYLKRGIIYYERKELGKALDNYITANKYLLQTEDDYSIYKVKYSIGHTKYYLGFYEDAIALFKECLQYFEEENDRAYLNTLHSLGLCYTKLGLYKLSSETNKLGLAKGIEFEDQAMEPYFIHSEGVNQYYLKNYQQAIKMLKAAPIKILKRNDFGNFTVANFYIAKSYWAKNQKEESLPYLLEVDKEITKQNYARPDLRENYELLLKYYKQRNNDDQQLLYINKLLKTDSILNKNYKYLSQKIFREYDTTKLKNEKLEIEKDRDVKFKIYSVVISVLLAVYLGSIYRHKKNQRYYKVKFEELMNSKISTKTSATLDNRNLKLDIKPEIIALILKNLQKFESNKKYLEKDMNLHKIAILLNTNTKYASKVILKYRYKKSIDYINDLKIDFIVEALKKDAKCRLYTYKALGEEAGFGSTQNFTKAFNRRTGMPPTYFIENLKKEQELK